MAADSTLPPAPAPESKVGAAARGIPAFYQAVMLEMRKVTWPEPKDVRRATVAIIIFVLLIGLLIFLLDNILQQILGRLIPSLFTGS